MEGLFFLRRLYNEQRIKTGSRYFCCMFQSQLPATAPAAPSHICGVITSRPACFREIRQERIKPYVSPPYCVFGDQGARRRYAP